MLAMEKLKAEEIILRLNTDVNFTEAIKAIDTSLGYVRIIEDSENRKVWLFEAHDVYQRFAKTTIPLG